VNKDENVMDDGETVDLVLEEFIEGERLNLQEQNANKNHCNNQGQKRTTSSVKCSSSDA